MTELIRAAVIVTGISGARVFVSMDIGRMLTTEADVLVWRVPLSRLFIRIPDWLAPIQHLAVLSLLIVIVLWVAVALTMMKRALNKKQ